MSGIQADTELVVEENQPDEYADAIAEAEDRFNQAELEQLQGTLTAPEEEASPEAAPEEASPEKTAPEEASSRKNGKGGKNLDFAKVVKDIEKTLGKDAAETVRNVQRDFTKNSQGVKAQLAATQERLDALQAELERRTGGPEKPAEPEFEVDPDLARLTPQQWVLFNKMAKAQGYISQAELEQQAKQEETETFVQSDIQDGLTRFGDKFGQMDEEGNFILSDEAFPDFVSHHERIYDPQRGLTAKDLFILSKFDQLIEEAKEEGARSAQAAPPRLAAPRPPARRAFTERQSSSVTSRPSLRTTGDSLEDVVRRAANAAFRESR